MTRDPDAPITLSELRRVSARPPIRPFVHLASGFITAAVTLIVMFAAASGDLDQAARSTLIVLAFGLAVAAVAWAANPGRRQ